MKGPSPVPASDSRAYLIGSVESTIVAGPTSGGRMRPFVRTAVLGLALATLTIAQEAPDSFLAERIFPPNALVFLSVPQSASISDDYAKSNLAKMVNHPEIKGFTDPLLAWWKKRKTQPANVG